MTTFTNITYDKNGNVVATGTVVAPPEFDNYRAIYAAAQAAITANQAFAATFAANRAPVVTAKTQAQSATTATVTTFPQAQTYVQGIAGQLVNVDTALLFIADQVSAMALQNNQIIRLLIGQLDAVT